MAAQLASALLQFGPIGIFAAYMIWREGNDRKDRKDETESRLKLATALATLAAAITGRSHV